MSARCFLPLLAVCLPCFGQSTPNCSGLPDAARLRTTVQSVVREGASKNGGLGNQEWAVIVNRDGIVCAIVFSGNTRGDQWPGSRVIAASKASTANGLSSDDYALSTANIFAASQPGQSLYGLATSAPPNPNAVFGDPATFGTPNDPMVGKAVGGVIVFGGGLALYNGQWQNRGRPRPQRRYLLHRSHHRLEGAPRAASGRGHHGTKPRAQRQHDPRLQEQLQCQWFRTSFLQRRHDFGRHH